MIEHLEVFQKFIYLLLDILVCLVKVQAESYGNRAIAGFRIIENKNSIHAQKHTSMQQNQRSVPQPMPRGPVNTQLPLPMPVVNPGLLLFVVIIYLFFYFGRM